MGTGYYICVTLRGGAPWGFTLREGEGDTYIPFLISQVEEGGRAFLAGVQEGDEVVSLNGEPCADLSLLRAFALIDTSIDCLQLLLKRYCSIPSRDSESEETCCSERESSGDALASTTLHILSPKQRSQSPTGLLSESQDEAHYGEMESITAFPKGPHQLCTQLLAPSFDQRSQESDVKENEKERCFSPGDMVELQVSLSEQRLDDMSCTSLGSAHGIEGEFSNREAVKTYQTSEPCPVREPLGQHGVVLSHPSMLGQVEVILQQPSASGAGRGILSVGGPRVSGSVGSQSEGEEGGGHNESIPGSFTVSFGIPAEEATPTVEEPSDSEGDQDKPNKHRARHARLRRSESLSEKQVKEAKSKCKRIALLLTAAPSNPNNKGVLMFKKHRQRAKKYTLVSYGTGEDEPENSDEEDEENDGNKEETHTVEFTLVAPKGSDIDKHFFTNAHSSEGVLTINWDKGLLEIERNLNNQSEMECLPDTKGKGALMFAQRRQRMDEIAAEHEELRRHGIPVEGVQETQKKTVEQSYVQSATEGHAYMDVNTHQQNQQQYQQYQEQQYYEQQPQQSYQQQQQTYQQQQQRYEQQYQQQQYEQQHYQQQMYQQQQEYHQEQQHMQQYSTNINGSVQHQSSEVQSSFTNRTAKPFSVENTMASPYSPAMSGTNEDSVGQEQIASRDERISTPAIRTGLLQDARRRNTGKPMFTFKDAPKVSPNPALLNLLNRPSKKLGFESGPEEDYLSLGAEACNFLQSPFVKHKTPPPVAPKPVINPNSPLWSSQIEMNNQDTAQLAENSVSTPAVAPASDATPPVLEPTTAPAPKPSPPLAPQEAPPSITTEKQHTWTLPEAQSQEQPMQATAQEENSHINSTLQSEQTAVTTWAGTQSQPQQQSTTSWNPAKMQPQEPPPNQTPPQEHWVTQQTTQTQAQPHPPTATWTPASQPSWSQPQEQAQIYSHGQPHWAHPEGQPQPEPQVQLHQPQPVEQPQSQPQVQPSWTHSHERPHVQHMQPAWSQPQEPVQQQAQAPWAQSLEKQSLHQPSWGQPPQQHTQVQASWVQQVEPESQPQPPWAQQPQQQVPQQAWPQAQAPGQLQPPWVSAQAQHSQQMNAWPQSHAQPEAQPSWLQTAQSQPQVQPQANLNPWAPVTTQSQSQSSWTQHPSEHSQHTMQSWPLDQNRAQNQPPWAQPVPPQSPPQANWQTSSSKTPPQPSINTAWPSAQSQPQTLVNTWAPESKQTPSHVSRSMVNDRPSPKPWHPPQNPSQNCTPPPPPQRMQSFTIGQRASSLINPMATTLNPPSAGSAYEMPVVRGKGAEMFAKRQSRMEKFVVDSETVQANKASRSTSPAASLPNEWKYTPNALGRSYSLSPPARVLPTGQKSVSTSFSPKPHTWASTTSPSRRVSWPEKGLRPLSPWEAASRHPLGLVDEAFASQNLHQTLASEICLAARRKMLPEPPAEWKSTSYQAPKKKGSQTWSPSQTRGQRRAPLPSFVSPAKTAVSTPTAHAGYGSLPRQWQPQKSVTEAMLKASVSSSVYKRPVGKQTSTSVYTSNTWSWRR